MFEEAKQAIADAQKRNYDILWKEDKARFENSSLPERFPRKIKRGDLDRILAENKSYVDNIYLRHCALDVDNKACSEIFGQEVEICEGVAKLRDKTADITAARMLANRTKRRVNYELNAYQRLTEDVKTEHDVLAALIDGPGNGYYNARLGKVDTRLSILDQYFSDVSSQDRRGLTVNQAKDIQKLLEEKSKSSYWKKTESERGYVSKAKAIIEKIDEYINKTPIDAAIFKKLPDSIDRLATMMGEEKSSYMISELKDIHPVNGNSYTPHEKKRIIAKCIEDGAYKARFASEDAITHGLSDFAINIGRLAEFSEYVKDRLKEYFVPDNSALNDAILAMTA